MRLSRASVVHEIAANIEQEHQRHPSKLGQSGYKCLVCGRFVLEITKGHARKCGFINVETMIAAGAVKQYRWGKEVTGGSK